MSQRKVIEEMESHLFVEGRKECMPPAHPLNFRESIQTARGTGLKSPRWLVFSSGTQTSFASVGKRKGILCYFLETANFTVQPHPSSPVWWPNMGTGRKSKIMEKIRNSLCLGKPANDINTISLTFLLTPFPRPFLLAWMLPDGGIWRCTWLFC